MPEIFAAAGADFEAFYLRHYKAIYHVCYAFLKQAVVQYRLNSTPFDRQYDILSIKWGVLLCQEEYQTNDIRWNSREWL